ncbi:MAG: Imm53 family immunity protein [Dongiaceae bacterium]
MPAWSLRIRLIDAPLEGRTFDRVTHGQPNGNLEEWQRTGSWWIAAVKSDIFEAHCGPLDLPTVIDIFRLWAEPAKWASPAGRPNRGERPASNGRPPAVWAWSRVKVRDSNGAAGLASTGCPRSEPVGMRPGARCAAWLDQTLVMVEDYW